MARISRSTARMVLTLSGPTETVRAALKAVMAAAVSYGNGIEVGFPEAVFVEPLVRARRRGKPKKAEGGE